MNGDWEHCSISPPNILRCTYREEQGEGGVEIIKRIGEEFPPGPEWPVNGCWAYSTWAYAILDSDSRGWQPMPHHIETLEDAKIFALTVWRLT